MEVALSKTELRVNGRTYEVFCELDDVEHTRLIGAHFSDIVDELAKDIGQIGDAPLFLLANIKLLDALQQQQRFNTLFEAGTRHYDVAHNIRWHFAIILDRIASRLEQIADEIERQHSAADRREIEFNERLKRRNSCDLI